MIYLAFDPGGTTGYAKYDNIENKIVTGHFENYTGLDALIREADLVIYEMPFRLPTTDVIVFEVKGAILERCHTLGKDIQPQLADVPKFINSAYSDFMKSPKIKKRLIHEKDALCHLVKFLTYTKTLTIEEIFDKL